MALRIFERLHDRFGEVPIIRALLGFWWRRSMRRSQRWPRRWLESADGFRPEDVCDLILGFGAENPRHVGRPSVQILRESAARRRSITDPWYEHLCSCSNCYRQVRAFQQRPWRASAHYTIH